MVSDGSFTNRKLGFKWDLGSFKGTVTGFDQQGTIYQVTILALISTVGCSEMNRDTSKQHPAWE